MKIKKTKKKEEKKRENTYCCINCKSVVNELTAEDCISTQCSIVAAVASKSLAVLDKAIANNFFAYIFFYESLLRTIHS